MKMKIAERFSCANVPDAWSRKYLLSERHVPSAPIFNSCLRDMDMVEFAMAWLVARSAKECNAKSDSFTRPLFRGAKGDHKDSVV